jgi:predicted RNA binding protein YcfA (HicA-like mRNA interferase family)
MRLPRDVGGQELARALAKYGYGITRQSGSHLRLTTERNGEHHVTIPMHKALRVGTLAAILADIADHVGVTREQLQQDLFS